MNLRESQSETEEAMAKITVAKNGKEGNLEVGREVRLAAIQMLIPLGLKAVAEELAKEVEGWAGPRYSRGGTKDRHGSNPGSVFLGDQKVSLGFHGFGAKRRGVKFPWKRMSGSKVPGSLTTWC